MGTEMGCSSAARWIGERIQKIEIVLATHSRKILSLFISKDRHESGFVYQRNPLDEVPGILIGLSGGSRSTRSSKRWYFRCFPNVKLCYYGRPATLRWALKPSEFWIFLGFCLIVFSGAGFSLLWHDISHQKQSDSSTNHTAKHEVEYALDVVPHL